MFGNIRHIHFVGIGGSGMSGIAEVLLNLGYVVSGSDQKKSPVTERLAAQGARTFEGHAAAHVEGAHVVVISTAVRPTNPEVVEARRLGIPVIPRAEMLAELMRLKYGVAVAGSHGKTTTTSMVAMILDKGGLDPTVVVGGRLGVLGSGARLGRGDFMVAEADESDRSFLKLSPTIAIVTNIDREHLDTYKDLADVQEAFLGFLNKVPFYGAGVVCLDDGPVQDILPRVERRVVTYGLSPQAQVSARDVQLKPMSSTYLAVLEGAPLGKVELAVPGAHNVLNSLAAVAVGLELAVSFESIRQGLAAFTGVDRRFQIRGDAGGILVVDDYGHHPTEIRATLETLRGRAGSRRTVVLFQPHRYTRTQHLWDEFCRAFHLADVLLLADIYPAGEEPVAGVTSEALAEAITRRGHRQVLYAGDLKKAADRLAQEVKDGDVVLTLGAGSVWTAGDELLKRRAAGAGKDGAGGS
ncbi:MAG TPA: UDP-N-acetylmuramate--L-alanine ligase [Vicinamibacteria bacterium]|nr:UDP-N-acetylmuramate--L-alanine ligase [Vicinamibacteria bacterium]